MSVDSTNKNQTTMCSYSTFNYIPLHSTMFPFVQLHSPLFNYIPLCSTMFPFVQLHSPLFNYIPLCSTMFPFVQLCSPLFNYVPLCSTMFPFTSTTPGMLAPSHLCPTNPCPFHSTLTSHQCNNPTMPPVTTMAQCPMTTTTHCLHHHDHLTNHKWRQPPTDEDAHPNNNEGTQMIQAPPNQHRHQRAEVSSLTSSSPASPLTSPIQNLGAMLPSALWKLNSEWLLKVIVLYLKIPQ